MHTYSAKKKSLYIAFIEIKSIKCRLVIYHSPLFSLLLSFLLRIILHNALAWIKKVIFFFILAASQNALLTCFNSLPCLEVMQLRQRSSIIARMAKCFFFSSLLDALHECNIEDISFLLGLFTSFLFQRSSLIKLLILYSIRNSSQLLNLKISSTTLCCWEHNEDTESNSIIIA